MAYTPSSGEEIQSEYLFPRMHAIGAIEAVRALADRIRPMLQVSEIRRVAADQLWMSMNYEQDSVGIHFTWKREPDAVQEMVAQIEDALTPFEARPHWGKVFHADAAAIAALKPIILSAAKDLGPRRVRFFAGAQNDKTRALRMTTSYRSWL